MELTNDFHVPAPVEKAWAILTNVELIAPCMPGAQLEEVEGEEYRGSVKIKVGPITAQYKGKATFLERDAANHVAKLKGEGRDSKGQGNASVTVTMTLKPGANGGTDVTVHNDLSISGKVAQFARASVVKEISEKLLGQFVECLHHKLDEVEDVAADIAAASAAAAPAAAAVSDAEATAPAAASSVADAGAEAAKPTVRKIEYKEAQPVDLLETAGTPIVKRVAPIAALVFLLVWLLRRSKK